MLAKNLGSAVAPEQDRGAGVSSFTPTRKALSPARVSPEPTELIPDAAGTPNVSPLVSPSSPSSPSSNQIPKLNISSPKLTTTLAEEDDYITETICCCCRRYTVIQEGLGFALASFARSPSVILAALVSPLTLQLAETDALCQINPATGYSTGVDGAVCTSNGEFSTGKWNDTVWRSLNGTSCSVMDAFGSLNYDIGRATFDSECAAALTSYRRLTSFTCNCTGDYAFLESGFRPGTILTFSATVYYLIMVFVAPIIGALSDVTPHRKRMWLMFATTYIISIVFMAVLGQQNVWIVSLFFATCAGPSYDLMCVPIMAYLPEIHHKETTRAKYAGVAQGLNYVAQFIFGIVMSILTVALYDTAGSVVIAQISCFLCGIWITFWTYHSYKRMAPREAGHLKNPGESLIKAAFSGIATTASMLYREHPMAARYLLTNMFGATGILANVALLTTYLVVQMEMGGSQIVVVYMLVMMTGAPSAALYGTCHRCFGAKNMYIFLMVFACLCNGILPFLINQPEQVLAVYAFAPFAGCYFGLFFAMQSLIFSNFIPVGEEAGCYGLQAFSSSIIRWISPLIYSAIVQATNDHRIALLHICVFYICGCISMVSVDFKKGVADVAKKGKARSGSRSPRSEGMVKIPK